MLKIKFLIIALILIAVKTFAQVDYSFSGYVVDMPIYTVNSSELSSFFKLDKSQFMNLTRLRLRPEVYLWSGARMNIEYEVDATYSKQSLFSFTNEVNTSRQIFNLRWTPYNKNNITITHYIDRLYLRQGFGWGNIIVGRQRIAWGVGRVWSPTDLFNPINPANFSKLEKDGVDAASLTYTFGKFTDLNLVYNPMKNSGQSNAGFRFRTNYDEYDLALVGGYFDKRIVAGGDFAGNFFDAGIRGEGIISMNKDTLSDNFVKFIFGMDNQFTSKLYAMFEYQYNGHGASNKDNYDLIGLINGKILNLAKNYLFLSASYILTPLITVTLSDNINLNDKSGYVLANGVYSVTGNATITAGALLTYGKTFTEYWYYPTSVYLQGELYF